MRQPSIQGVGFGQNVQRLMRSYKARARNIVAGSMVDTFSVMTREQLSVKITGSYREGYVPVDTRELIESLVVFLNGAEIARGDISFGALGQRLGIGDTVTAVFTVDHAQPMEYGFVHKDTGQFIPGRFYVTNAREQFPIIVAQNVAYYTRGG